jgi:hypothetical protein
MNLRNWLRLAVHPATVRRAQLTSLVVGTILGVINHGPALLAGQVKSEQLFQIFLTFLVPYTVSTISSVATRRELCKLTTVTPITPERSVDLVPEV